MDNTYPSSPHLPMTPGFWCLSTVGTPVLSPMMFFTLSVYFVCPPAIFPSKLLKDCHKLLVIPMGLPHNFLLANEHCAPSSQPTCPIVPTFLPRVVRPRSTSSCVNDVLVPPSQNKL